MYDKYRIFPPTSTLTDGVAGGLPSTPLGLPHKKEEVLRELRKGTGVASAVCPHRWLFLWEGASN